MPIDLALWVIDCPLEGYLAASLVAWERLLYGNTKAVEGIIEKIRVPTYKEARQQARVTDNYVKLAQGESHDFHREAH